MKCHGGAQLPSSAAAVALAGPALVGMDRLTTGWWAVLISSYRNISGLVMFHRDMISVKYAFSLSLDSASNARG